MTRIMSVDRRAEEGRYLEGILQIQGYDIIPVVRYGLGPDLPLPESDRVDYIWLGDMPAIENPLTHKKSIWAARASRYLVYDPSKLEVISVIPDPNMEGEGKVIRKRLSSSGERMILNEAPRLLAEEGMTIVDTSNSDGRIVGIRERPVESAVTGESLVATA